MKTPILALAALLTATAGHAKTVCGTIGPHSDYRVATETNLRVVEERHFNEDVELGIKGITTTAGGDAEYTLRKFPNHTRALNTMLRLAQRSSSGLIPGASLPAECYFERAVRAFPDDSAAWLLYARHQYMLGREAQALSMLQKAFELSPEDAAINYNLGLIYAKQKKYAQALPYAQKAYALKFPLPGLKQMLVNAGQWVEPPPLPAPAEEAAPAADAAPVDAAPPGKP
ncbi:MAG: hypothetical protein K0R43_680 [Pseudoduganella sp.]|jgi:hypothetical protein|nr:hypothetical protein [Pseudoduganella sp.]